MVRILLIDDSVFINNMIANILGNEKFSITSVNTADAAFNALKKDVPDLILLSMVLTDMDGHLVCRKLKNMSSLKSVPIIFVTSNSDELSLLKGFEAGATDYIVKPFNAAELKARIDCHLQNKRMADELRIINQKLVGMMEELKMQSYKDPFLGIYNRKYFFEHVELWRAQQVQENFKSFIYLVDIDIFKYINDSFGHPAGDYTLQTVVNLLKQKVPGEAVVIRWGGDEFLLMVFCITAQDAAELGDTLKNTVGTYPFSFDGNQFRSSLSIGYTEFYSELKIEDLIKLADKALYASKERGRNLCTNAADMKSQSIG